MAKKKFVIKMGSYEPKRRGTHQPGLDLSRTIEDTLVDDGLATRTSDCCELFASFPARANSTDTAIPNNSMFSVGTTLYWKNSDGNLYTFDITVV